EWLQSCTQNSRPERVLDYGCGTGTASLLFRTVLGASSVIGVDTSAEAIALAERTATDGVTFQRIDDYRPSGDVDIAYCNGVFHHIPPAERAGAIRYVRDSLRTGGLFSFWENNPWNPGTRIVMSRIPFDRDAILVSALEARRLLRAQGFEILSTHFLFVFPKFLSALRKLETPLARLPLGAQYQVLCRKPS
ncbi:MAG TPA: class I SAM-dependent methyltransferase, partial [Polyangiaceae bacterium]|nr:class I SAM-dependent methyltransferase [Polyangiaceae bacterium]